MKWFSYIWDIIKAIAGYGSQTHDNAERDAGRDAQKVDNANQLQQEVLDAKHEETVANNSAAGDSDKWMHDNGFTRAD